MKPKIIFGAIAVVLQFFAPLSTSVAAGKLVNIQICNNFPVTVNFAMAYPQTTGGPGDWISRGWTNAATGYCYYFDTALHVPVFYFRAQTGSYRDKGHSVKETWGNEGANVKSFCVAKSFNATFNFWQADIKSSCNGSYVSFVIDSGDSTHESDVDETFTLTFDADGTIESTFAPLKPIAPPAK